MKVSTGGRLSDLIEEGVGIAEHYPPQWAAPFQFLAEYLRFHAQACPRYLDIDAGRSSLVAQQYRQANEPLVADCANLRGLTVCHRVNQRADAAHDEIDKLDPLVGIIQWAFVLYHRVFEM